MKELIYKRAKAKLERIIEREGTCGGKRLASEYYDELLNEAERELMFETITTGGLITA